MESEERNLFSLTGQITAMSHSLRLSSGNYIMFLEVDSNRKQFILVRHVWQLVVFSYAIKIFDEYHITKLRRGELEIGGNKVSLLIATNRSKLKRIENKEDISNLPAVPFGLVTYKGKVSQVIDKDAGIYLLDGKNHLVATFLKDLTAEICNGKFRVVVLEKESNEEDEKKLKDARRGQSGAEKQRLLAVEEEVYTKLVKKSHGRLSSEDSEINIDNFLNVGDWVTVYNAHCVSKDGCQRLICCGRSLIINHSCKLFKKSTDHSRWINQTIHKYNPPVGSLSWLLSLRQSAVDLLAPKLISEFQIDLSKDGNGEGLLSRLLHEACNHKLLAVERRLIAGEFLLSKHTCPVTRSFEPPFHLVTFALLKSFPMQKIPQEGVGEDLTQSFSDYNNEEKHNQDAKHLWNFSMSSVTKPYKVLVGKLEMGANGGLQLQQKSGCMDIILLKGSENFEMGSLVALFDYSLVDEEFNIMKGKSNHNVHKTYILVSDMCILKEPCIDIPQSQSEYRIKVLSKSPLIYNHSNANSIENLRNERFFMVNANISRIDTNEVVVEEWQRFIRFKGKLSDLNPIIEEGDLVMVKCTNTFQVLKQTQVNFFLKGLSSHFPSLECVYLPEDTIINKISSSKNHYGEVNVREILETSSTGLTCVIGIVKSKQFMTPRFISQISKLHIDLSNSCDIGVPGSKGINLLLADQEKHGKEIWLYLRDVSSNFVQEYAKGVVPGTKVLVTFCERKVARNTRNVYLHGTIYSRVVPLAGRDLIGNHSQVLGKSASFTPSFQLLRDSIISNMTFFCFATIAKIKKIVMKPICTFCDSDMEGGLCSYIGCQAPPSPKITVSAEIVIDDGTKSVCVFTNKSKQVEDILKMSHSERINLSNLILSHCKALMYVISRKRKREEENPERKYESFDNDLSLENELFKKVCTRSELLRPMKFTLRKMTPKINSSINFRYLYCEEVAELRPCIYASELKT